MNKKGKTAFAIISLICGLIALVCAAVLLLSLTSNVSEYDPKAVLVIVAALISIFAGGSFAVLAIVFGCIGFAKATELAAPSRRNMYRTFCIIGIAGGALLIVEMIALVFFNGGVHVA